MTYLQRYSLVQMLGLAASNDDDGKAGGNGGTISEDQAAELIALADEVGADKRAFCEYFKIDGIAMMPAKDFERAAALRRLSSAGWDTMLPITLFRSSTSWLAYV